MSWPIRSANKTILVICLSGDLALNSKYALSLCARACVFPFFGRTRLISGPIGLEKVPNDWEFSQESKTIEKTAKFDHLRGAREKTRAYARAPKMRKMS